MDIDPRYANSPVLDRVSGDTYTVYKVGWPPFAPFTWRVYQNSWIVDHPEVVWSRCYVVIRGSVRFLSGASAPTSIHVRIPWKNFSPAGPAEVTFTGAQGSTTTYVCPRQSDSFRDVSLEIDVCASVNVAPLRPSYDTHAHPTRPAGLPQRVLTIEEAYREAGIAVTINPAHTVIDDSDPQFTSWSDSELHDALETHFSRYMTNPTWSLWGVMAGQHDDSGTAGIMFDYGTMYGGPGRSPERQGFAVFRGHSWFSNLPAGAPANDAEAETLRNFLYVWIHEAGHAFNFLHSWNKGRPDSLSWMNYPHYVTDYWNDFEFRFDDEELLHLRHGNRSEVIFGGDPWSTGGHFEVPAGAMVQMEGSAPVELLLRSSPFFDFLEPVTVEVRLRNLTEQLPVVVETRLQPEYGRLDVFIQRPDGSIVEYAPIINRDGTPQLRTLSPASAGGEGADRYSDAIPLTFDQHGFVFDSPGEYRLRASYRGLGDVQIVSNTLRLRIGTPATREEDRLAQDYFQHEVGMSLYLGGSQSPFLRSGMAVLEDIAERYSDSLVGAKAATVVANSIAQPFFRMESPDQPVMIQTHAPDPDRALAITEPALELYRTSDARAQNIAYHDLARLRATLLTTKGNTKAAQQVLTKLRTDLKARGVNDSVLSEIQTFKDSLQTADN